MQRDGKITFRATDKEKAALERISASEGVPVGTVLNRMLADHYGEPYAR